MWKEKNWWISLIMQWLPMIMQTCCRVHGIESDWKSFDFQWTFIDLSGLLDQMELNRLQTNLINILVFPFSTEPLKLPNPDNVQSCRICFETQSVIWASALAPPPFRGATTPAFSSQAPPGARGPAPPIIWPSSEDYRIIGFGENSVLQSRAARIAMQKASAICLCCFWVLVASC